MLRLEEAGVDQVEHGLQLGILLVVVARPVAPLQLRYLWRGEAEEEEVVRADLVADLDVRPIQGADGERAVEGELHVAGAARFLAGSGDLLGEVRGGEDPLRQRDPVVGEEDHPQLALDGRILVDRGGDGVDQLDDQLGGGVRRRRLAAEDERARHDREIRVLLHS